MRNRIENAPKSRMNRAIPRPSSPIVVTLNRPVTSAFTTSAQPYSPPPRPASRTLCSHSYPRRVATTAPQAFERFKTRLTLTTKQRDALRERRERVRSLLSDEWSIDTVMFGGSHARGSKIRPVLGRQGDVDIYVVLKGDERHYGGLLQPPSAKLLADVKKTLDRYLKTPKVRADSPAVRITYDDMIVDVVPAFARFLSDAFDIPYYKTWMVATPRAQQRVFKQLDDARGGKFKPLLRMLKHWKAVHHTIGLRSVPRRRTCRGHDGNHRSLASGRLRRRAFRGGTSAARSCGGRPSSV